MKEAAEVLGGLNEEERVELPCWCAAFWGKCHQITFK